LNKLLESVTLIIGDMFQRRGIGGDQLFKCSQYNMFEMLLFFIIVNILGVDSLQSQPIDAQFLK